MSPLPQIVRGGDGFSDSMVVIEFMPENHQ
jgi:hypothetical protein